MIAFLLPKYGRIMSVIYLLILQTMRESNQGITIKQGDDIFIKDYCTTKFGK